MKQLTQKLKNGRMQVVEVPAPVLGTGMILVRNHYSVISAGTEGGTVKAARKGLIGKAKERPQQVKQVVEVLKQQGPVQAYRTVMKKLDSYSPLGYSSAGEVLEVAPDVTGFALGDLVACAGGGYASHAEIIAVPVNLCVKLPLHKKAEVKSQNDEGLKKSLKFAAYNTLGAIALQGIRQADVRIGESCAVIGLGLIGQLTCLILRAGGIKVVGIDIDPKMVEIASRHCADIVFLREAPGIEEKIDEFTDGIGVDTVIITAAAKSLDPVNFSGKIVRKRGKVVIVGDVPTGFDREPYYRKELELRMSCSYGPGRYDMNYEEKGVDYPAGYVRWTENRNMKAFQNLIHSGKIDIEYLTTHIFKLEDAPTAYDLILEKQEPYLGILIEYDATKKELGKKIIITQKAKGRKQEVKDRVQKGAVTIGFLGAGSYAMNYLLPNIPKDKDVVLKGVMTASGTSSRTAAEKYRFRFCTSDENDIFNDKGINTVFIATRHDSHAGYVIHALEAGKHVFVEKPLCMTHDELNKLSEIYTSAFRNHKSQVPRVMVGFNRRFAPFAEILKAKLGDGPMAMIYRINAGLLPADSWIQDKDIGGGRIIGEVCHFVDFLTFVNGSLPEYCFATAMPDPAGREDTVNINMKFRNGSIGTISYFSNGPKGLLKEYIEIYRASVTAIVKDFKVLEIHGKGKTFKKKLLSQDKGQKRMIETFIRSIREPGPAPIGFDEIYSTTLTTFKIIESLRTGEAVRIE